MKGLYLLPYKLSFRRLISCIPKDKLDTYFQGFAKLSIADKERKSGSDYAHLNVPPTPLFLPASDKEFITLCQAVYQELRMYVMTR